MIYVTGSHGFLGSRLIKRLAAAIPVKRQTRAVGGAGDVFYWCGAYGNKFQQTDAAEMVRANVPTL